MALVAGRCWLDYGCGRGDLLEGLQAEGCAVWGVETQEDCVAALNRRFPGRVETSLERLDPPPGGWDGIVFYHVLEHLENPESVLRSLRHVVHPEAVLFLAVPNWSSWERRIFADRWFHLDPPRHVQHFSAENAAFLLDKTGWRVRRVEFKVTAYDLFGLFQSLLNLGPGPRNYFYRRLKRGETFDHWTGFFWTVLAALPAVAAALLFVPLLACLGRTGTFEVTACAMKDAS
jgi:SAM-dependent methyltransferase